MSPTPRPSTVRIRMYQVGFGDCFLLSLEYTAPLPDGRSERHMLIDCGSTRPAASTSMTEVVALITEHTGGQLDVLVVSHRHRDHLSALGTAATGDALAQLNPRLVIQPWTEHPDAPADATGPSALDDSSRRFAVGLQEASRFAALLGETLDGSRGLRGELARFAADQISNRAAVDRLAALGAAGEARYLHAGQPTGIEEFVPGMKARALGPPTVDQWPEVARQRADDPEYWIAQRRFVATALSAADIDQTTAARTAAALAGTDPDAGPLTWLVKRMSDRQVASLLRIVTDLDRAMNNTSMVLLFDIGDHRLLFSGDAQIENWSYILKDKRRRNLLRDVDLYKVGHHGSRNGTPRTLVNLLADKTQPTTSLLSTLPGVHGHTDATGVPRSTLINALDDLGPLWRTDKLRKGKAFLELEAASGAAFGRV